MINIINKIKNYLIKLFVHKKCEEVNYTDEQLELFNIINPGDLVFCEMPLPEEELNKISFSHRTRPYLVLHKNRHSFFGLYCSSNYRYYFKNKRAIVLNVEDYDIGHYVGGSYEQISLEYIDLRKEYVLDITKMRDILLSLDNKSINKINLAIMSDNKKHKANKHLIDNGKPVIIPKYYYKRC